MGQYYQPIGIRKNKITAICTMPGDFNGRKLMEHSYYENTWVGAALTYLYHNPARLAWIGDYSDEFYGEDAYEKKMPQDKFLKFFKVAWGERRPHRENIPPLETKPEDELYLVNHTQKTYVDLAKTWFRNICHEKWIDREGEKHEYDYAIHPLPLLTACGNDRGGGDYRKRNQDFDKVGTWAFDRIEVTEEPPVGYKQELVNFKEV